ESRLVAGSLTGFPVGSKGTMACGSRAGSMAARPIVPSRWPISSVADNATEPSGALVTVWLPAGAGTATQDRGLARARPLVPRQARRPERSRGDRNPGDPGYFESPHRPWRPGQG